MLLRDVSTLLLMCCWASRSTETSETAALWVWTPSDSTAEEESRMLFYFRKVDVFDTTLISAALKIFLTCLSDSLLFKFISLPVVLPPVCNVTVLFLTMLISEWATVSWCEVEHFDPETWWWVSTADVEQIGYSRQTRINPDGFGDRLTLPRAPPPGQTSHSYRGNQVKI